MGEAVIAAIITGGISLLGIYFSNQKTVVTLNARFSAHQEKVEGDIALLRETINKHDELRLKVAAIEVEQKSQWKAIHRVESAKANGGTH